MKIYKNFYKKKPKHNNKKVVYFGNRFDSKTEGDFYLWLLSEEKKGKLKLLEIQPKVYLTNAKILYKPDFLIEENNKKVYLEIKGHKTATYNIKLRLWKHYGPGPLREYKIINSSNFLFKITEHNIL